MNDLDLNKNKEKNLFLKRKPSEDKLVFGALRKNEANEETCITILFLIH